MVPSYQDATDALETARSRSAQPLKYTQQPLVLPPTPLQQAHTPTMAPKGKGENIKKVAGNAKKAEVAAQKAAAADRQKEAEEQKEWSKGAKSTDKKAAEADKKAAAAAAKAERDRLLAEEEKNQPSKPKGAGKKVAEKKVAPKLNLDDLDRDSDEKDAGPKRERTLNATGIDNALDALSLTANNNAQAVERHPERRFKAAYKAFEERRIPEIEAEQPGLRRNQRVEQARKEFEKHPDNPFNQVSVGFDASREEVREVKKKVRDGVEGRLGDR